MSASATNLPTKGHTIMPSAVHFSGNARIFVESSDHCN